VDVAGLLHFSLENFLESADGLLGNFVDKLGLFRMLNFLVSLMGCFLRCFDSFFRLGRYFFNLEDLLDADFFAGSSSNFRSLFEGFLGNVRFLDILQGDLRLLGGFNLCLDDGFLRLLSNFLLLMRYSGSTVAASAPFRVYDDSLHNNFLSDLLLGVLDVVNFLFLLSDGLVNLVN